MMLYYLDLIPAFIIAVILADILDKLIYKLYLRRRNKHKYIRLK